MFFSYLQRQWKLVDEKSVWNRLKRKSRDCGHCVLYLVHLVTYAELVPVYSRTLSRGLPRGRPNGTGWEV